MGDFPDVYTGNEFIDLEDITLDDLSESESLSNGNQELQVGVQRPPNDFNFTMPRAEDDVNFGGTTSANHFSLEPKSKQVANEGNVYQASSQILLAAPPTETSTTVTSPPKRPRIQKSDRYGWSGYERLVHIPDHPHRVPTQFMHQAEEFLQENVPPLNYDKKENDFNGDKNSRQLFLTSTTESKSSYENLDSNKNVQVDPTEGQTSHQNKNAGLVIHRFMVAGNSLYLYRGATFVRRTDTHLQCQAHQCTYQTYNMIDHHSAFEDMRSHIDKTHRTDEKSLETPHPCQLCHTHNVFPNQEEFWHHTISAHCGILGECPDVVCEFCMATLSRTGIKKHLCLQKITMKQNAAARGLMSKNFEEPEKEYACDYEYCSKTFLWLSDLQRHQISHRPRLMYCQQCDMRIFQNVWYSHLKLLHPQRRE